MLMCSSGCGGVCCAMAEENASVALQFESANPTQQGLTQEIQHFCISTTTSMRHAEHSSIKC
jgi:hypothetical protein